MSNTTLESKIVDQIVSINERINKLSTIIMGIIPKDRLEELVYNGINKEKSY